MTTVFSNGSADTICNQLDMTLEGLEAPEGIDTDGYRASYAYTLTHDLMANDVQMTCFGFAADQAGYFCVGAVGQAASENEYSTHGVGYWAYTAEQLADRNYGEEEVQDEEVETGDDAEVEEYDLYEDEAAYDDYAAYDEYGYGDADMGAELLAWAMSGNMMSAENNGAEFDPAQVCEAVDDGYGFLDSSACAVVPFAGSWYQPAMADTYAGNYRFSPEDSGAAYATCISVGAGAWTEDITLAELTGATALSAGAAIVLAMMY